MRISTKTQMLSVSSNKTLVIFFHGLYSSALDPLAGSTIRTLSKKLQEDHKATVGLYQTSRNFQRDGRELREWASESFAGKTFPMEKNDVGDALKEITEQASGYTRLVFVGFSLGGTLSTYFLDEYRPDVVLMFGSGCETRNKAMPIGSTYPPKKEILNNLKSFTGILKIFQGTSDTVVPKSGAMQMIRAAKKAERRDFIQLQGVDHRFLLRDGKQDSTIMDLVYKEITDVI